MNRDQYITMRKNNQYDFNWFYEYYVKNKNNNNELISFDNFIRQFGIYFRINSEQILDFLDVKMKIIKIESKEGDLLYIN